MSKPALPVLLTRLRLASGLVLFTYVTLHFAMHATGNISLDAMEESLLLHEFLWRGAIGSVLLYGAFTAHIALAFWALYARRSFRLERTDLARLVLGFVMLFLLIHHYVGGRLMWDMHGAERGYSFVLLTDFLWHPELGLRLSLLFVIAWVHGCIGLYFWLRHRSWFRRWSSLLLALVVAFPLTAALGVVHGVQEAIARAQHEDNFAEVVKLEGHAASEAERAMQDMIEETAVGGYFALLLLVAAARGARALFERHRAFVRITYPGGQAVQVPRGVSVLDASRRGGIAHMSVCGGRGRCSTCRVRVLHGVGSLPPPGEQETHVLARLGAGPSVRLACQLQPTSDITVVPLLASVNEPARERGAVERFAAILFVDIRGSTQLVEGRPPFDVVFLVNRFCDVVSGAVVAAGGTPAQFLGDGVMAIFGQHRSPERACRQALDAARRISEAVAALNRELSEVLPQPIQIGVGIHAGDAIIGRMGYRDSALVTAVGETVHVASRLQNETKTYGAYLVASDVVMRTAGFDDSALRAEEIQVRGRNVPVGIRIVLDAASVPSE